MKERKKQIFEKTKVEQTQFKAVCRERTKIWIDRISIFSLQSIEQNHRSADNFFLNTKIIDFSFAWGLSDQRKLRSDWLVSLFLYCVISFLQQFHSFGVQTDILFRLFKPKVEGYEIILRPFNQLILYHSKSFCAIQMTNSYSKQLPP